MDLIKTSDLERWARTKASQNRFPYWLKKLILATVEPSKLRFPSDDATWLPGYDGVVTIGDETRFVPFGHSAWEVGTGKDYSRKAKEDYDKRSNAPEKDGEPKHSETTFVFATPRVWRDKEAWATKLKAERVWKDIVVLDGVDVVDWLVCCPESSRSYFGRLFADSFVALPRNTPGIAASRASLTTKIHPELTTRTSRTVH